MFKGLLILFFGGLLLTGVLFILGSILSLADTPFYTRWDDWSKHSKEESYTMIKSGIIFIIISFIFFKYIEHRIPEKQKKKKIQFTICPTCKESFNYKDLKDGKCPYCKDVDTIEIEEYYKIYPEEKG